MINTCSKVIKLSLVLLFSLIFFIIPTKAFALNYARTPAGPSITTPVTINFSFSDISDMGWVSSSYYYLSLSGEKIDYQGICHAITENNISENINLSVGWQSFGVYVVGAVSPACDNSGEIADLEVNSGNLIFTVSDSVATPTPTPTPTSSSSSSTTTTTTTTIIITPTPTPKPLVDTIPPAIFLNTDFSKPFTKAPKITGKASDSGAINVGVAKVEYSIDDGKNWSPVDEGTTSFDFTPVIFEDGNYKVKARARDNSGNIGYSKTYTLIIDRLPPQVGGILFSLGPQVLIPTKEGIIFTLQRLDTKITLSAVGGPLTIDLSAGTQNYSLVKNIDNGLWSGILNFANSGVYELTAKAVDGADNRTERQLNTIVVLENGKILSGNSPLTSGTATLWYFDNQTQKFVVWDAVAYGQANPQPIGKNGEYGFIAPSGKYYLEVKSYGFKTLRTEIFTLNSSMPITAPLEMKRSLGIQIGPFFLALPDFSASKQSITIQSPIVPAEAKQVNNIVGNEFPNANLFSGTKKISTVSFQGKPSVFTFLSTWSPYTPQQLSQTEGLFGNSQINVLPVISQETASSVAIFQKRGGYSLPIFADPDGLLVKPLNLSFLPTHVFVSRKGTIQKVIVGVLTKDELLENMVN